ncbi:MAG TPA: hypothetical protein VK638_39310, partial [Edaphobacter sp.]|nr:hypothetical protein [Edaphobacter sp.]
MAEHITMIAIHMVPKHGGNFGQILRNVLKAIDEIMGIFSFLAIVVGDGLQTRKANDVRVLDRFS